MHADVNYSRLLISILLIYTIIYAARLPRLKHAVTHII